jgi:o-succinylbenzoate---CoA ligase
MADLLAVVLPRPTAAAEIVRAWEAGDAVLPLDPAAPGPELRGTLAALRPTRLRDRDGLARLHDGEPVEDGVAAVVATSGTTGTPKGVELTAEGIEASCRAVSAALGAGRGDRWLACVGLHSVAGLAIVARAWHAGLPLEVHEGFEVDAVSAAAAAGATLVSVVPTMLARLLDAGAGLERFRQVLLGGAPAPAELVERAVDRGVPLVRTYGLTETFGGVVHDGHPLDGVELAIVADGEITLRGPMVLRRYRRDPTATRSALRGGWLHTADLGRIGPDGRLRVLGRRDDLVITGGVSVQPAEVEAVLVRHPAVADVAVGPAPDPEWGQRLVAYVVPVDRLLPPSLADLRAFARERLVAAKAPRELVLMDALPRTASGKILRRRLQSPTPAGSSPAASDDAVAEG